MNREREVVYGRDGTGFPGSYQEVVTIKVSCSNFSNLINESFQKYFCNNIRSTICEHSLHYALDSYPIKSHSKPLTFV